ncbi:MAG: sugar ABC transporter permease [Gemmatimonadota bacterium]|nr:MAG: sugar ABC transporter permease [Gemmatimonadota bacterium]
MADLEPTSPLQRGKWGHVMPYLFLLPAAIIIVTFRLLPILSALAVSFFDASFGKIRGFVGLDQYAKLFADPEFWNSAVNTVWFVVGAVPLSVATSLFFALLLRKGIRGLGLYRTIYFLPVVTSFVAVSMVWKLIFHVRFGLANALIEKMGGNPLEWLEEPTGIFELMLRPLGWDLPTWAEGPSLALICVVIVSVWRGIGYNVVIFLAGLQNIPEHYYEAARIDGAGRAGMFRHVTWPLLTPTTFYVVVMTTILSFQVFAPIYLMTGPPVGGPLGTTNVIVYYLFEKGFDAGGNMGYASAVALVLFAVILVLTLFQRKVVEKRVHYA